MNTSSARRLTTARRVVIDSQIPAAHPHKSALECVFLETMEQAAGAWKITLRRHSAWWAIALDGGDRVIATMLHERDLEPSLIRSRLLEILERHGLRSEDAPPNASRR